MDDDDDKVSIETNVSDQDQAIPFRLVSHLSLSNSLIEWE